MPVIVDTGISTYNPGAARLYERGTAAHNTVNVLGRNSSGIWLSFRVARRAAVKILEDQENYIVARHDGYKTFGTIHRRQWKFFDCGIEIIDNLTGKVVCGKFYLHIAPEYRPELKDRAININNIKICFKNADMIEIVQTKLPNGYNQFVENYAIEVSFEKCLETCIEIN
jgi:hypothetical protein